MTTRPAMPPDFLDCDPGLGYDDPYDENVPTPWDVLARWHREDGFVVDGNPPTVITRSPRGGAAPNDDFRTRPKNRDERHRRRGWTLSLRDGGPPPGVRATVCTLAWTTAGWLRFAPNRALRCVDARHEETGSGAPTKASAAQSACDAWTAWETNHAIAIAALTKAFERRVLSLSNPSDRIRKRAATKAAAAAGDTPTVTATRVSLASLPSNSTDQPQRGTRWDALQVANVVLRAIERTRTKARAIARLASQPPPRARGDPREAEAQRRRARATRDAGRALDAGLGRLIETSGLGGTHHSCIPQAGEEARSLSTTAAMGARAAVAEILGRGADVGTAAMRRERREGVRAVAETRPETENETKTKTETFAAAERSGVRAKVIASSTPRRALEDASNRRSMFSPVSPGAVSPATTRSRIAGTRR